MKNALVLIPCHLESKRLPNKPLLKANGLTLLQYTYSRISQFGFDENNVAVLTSDMEIVEHCQEYEMNYYYPPKVDIPTGTHRISKFVHDSDDSFVNQFDWFVNWQVDEPLVDPANVQLLLEQAHPDEIGTLIAPISVSERNDPNVTKVVWLPDGVCVWFTRALIMTKYGHIGIYLYHRQALEYFYSMGRQQTSYAFNERLEQLNWIERSPQYSIIGRFVDNRPLSINTQKDWETFQEMVTGVEEFDVD